MNKLSSLLVLFGIVFITACGSGGGGSSGGSPSSGGTAPTISNLTYSPTGATVGQGGGAVTVTLSMNFIDADGDITTGRITSSGGVDVSGALAGMSGLTSGSLQMQLASGTSQAGNWTFQVWVVDGQGNASNKLSGTFTVS